MSPEIKELAAIFREISSELDKGVSEDRLKEIVQQNNKLEYADFLRRQFENGAVKRKIIGGKVWLKSTSV